MNKTDSNFNTITPYKVRSKIISTAQEIRKKNSSACKNRLISVKIDGATRKSRAFLGINIQFIDDGKLEIFNLGTIELFDRHTAENLRNEVIAVLKKYEIKSNQVFSVTTDNGANYVTCSKLFNDSDKNIPETAYDFAANDSFDEIEQISMTVIEVVEEDEDDNLQDIDNVETVISDDGRSDVGASSNFILGSELKDGELNEKDKAKKNEEDEAKKKRKKKCCKCSSY